MCGPPSPWPSNPLSCQWRWRQDRHVGPSGDDDHRRTLGERRRNADRKPKRRVEETHEPPALYAATLRTPSRRIRLFRSGCLSELRGNINCRLPARLALPTPCAPRRRLFSCSAPKTFGLRPVTHRQGGRRAIASSPEPVEASFCLGKCSDRARGGETHGHHTDAHVRTWYRHDRRREIRHLRFFARHHLRMVRLLSLRRAGAVLRRAVLPDRQRYRRAAVGIRDLRGRLPGASVRRAGVRPHRRSRRAQIYLPGHHHGDGHLDLPGRPVADLRHDRLAGADPAGDAAAAARASRSAANMAAPQPTSPSIRGLASAASRRAGSRPRRRSVCCSP